MNALIRSFAEDRLEDIRGQITGPWASRWNRPSPAAAPSLPALARRVAAQWRRCQSLARRRVQTTGALTLVEAYSAGITAVRRENGTAEGALLEKREGIGDPQRCAR